MTLPDHVNDREASMMRLFFDASPSMRALLHTASHVEPSNTELKEEEKTVTRNDREVEELALQAADKLYARAAVLSGLFENQNLKKHIAHYKEFQVLVTFVK